MKVIAKTQAMAGTTQKGQFEVKTLAELTKKLQASKVYWFSIDDEATGIKISATVPALCPKKKSGNKEVADAIEL